jgi:hypothetical protein
VSGTHLTYIITTIWQWKKNWVISKNFQHLLSISGDCYVFSRNPHSVKKFPLSCICCIRCKVRSSMISELRRAIAEDTQCWSVIGWVTKNLLSRASPCFGRQVKPLVPAAFAITNPLWAPVVGYGPFSSCVIHKEGLCPSSGDINRLMMMMKLHLMQWNPSGDFWKTYNFHWWGLLE